MGKDIYICNQDCYNVVSGKCILCFLKFPLKLHVFQFEEKQELTIENWKTRKKKPQGESSSHTVLSHTQETVTLTRLCLSLEFCHIFFVNIWGELFESYTYQLESKML